ncbi:MAG TPA: hypothetical protein PKK00_14945 [Bacteroidales bacterium]|nr:hypothetical protein [Bacteroidales bacterium]
MEPINFKRAFYLKLGEQGKWEDDLKNGDKARIGWSDIDINDIQKKDWAKIRLEIEKDFKIREKKNGATQDFNALKSFCEATDEDIFITFFDGKLYWCVLDNTIMQQDEKSKFRTTKMKWTCNAIDGKILYINQISGRISKTQGYRATLCSIEEKDTLKRIINAEKSPIIDQIEKKKAELCDFIQKAFAELHWKDLETLADLIFRQSGWRRISRLGEKMKYVDLELEDPITKDLYQVQVKASAGKQEFEEYAEQFTGLGYKELFFVVFKPDRSLLKLHNYPENVTLLTGQVLAELIIDLGLLNWVTQKIN